MSFSVFYWGTVVNFWSHSLLSSKWCTRARSLSCVRLFADPMDFGPPGSSVHGISQQEYWSGLPFPTPGDLPDQGLNLYLLHCRQILYHRATGEALFTVVLPTSGSGAPNSFLFLKHIKLFLILGPSNLLFHVPRFLMSHFSCPKQYYSPSFYLVWLTLHSPGLGRKAVVVKSSESYPTLWDPMDCSLPGSSVHGISQQEYWSGLPFPSPGDLPDPGIKPASPVSPALAGRFFTTNAS